jgi:hypothetical protein
MRYEINCNDRVRVKLRQPGRDIIEARRDKMRALQPDRDWSGLYAYDADGFVTLQLWDAVQLFGPAMYMGADSPIEMEFTITRG